MVFQIALYTGGSIELPGFRDRINYFLGVYSMRSNRFVIALAALGLCALFGSQQAAAAPFLTTEADVLANDPGAPGGANASPLEGVEIINVSGRIFTNTVSPAGPGGTGAEVRSVFAVAIDVARNGVNHTPVLGPGAGTESLLFLGAVQGNVTSVGPGTVFTATFTTGRLGLFSTPGTFIANDPDTYSFATGADAEWALSAPNDIAPLNGALFTFPASLVNVSSVNSAAGQSSQGRFLFDEDSPAGEVPGDAFITTMSGFALGPLDVEGLFALVSQTIENTGSTDILGPTDLAVLNAIAAFAGLANLGGAGTAFATGEGGAALTDFSPAFAGTINTNGDFRAVLTGELAPGVEFIPEPTSLLVWSVGALGFCLQRRWTNRRRTQA